MYIVFYEIILYRKENNINNYMLCYALSRTHFYYLYALLCTYTALHFNPFIIFYFLIQ